MANSILYLGSGSGALMFPVLYRASLDYYGLQGTLWIIAGFLLNVTFAGSLMLPLSWFSKSTGTTHRADQKRLLEDTNGGITSDSYPEITIYEVKPLTNLKDDDVMILRSYDKLHQTSQTKHLNLDLQRLAMERRAMSETDVRNGIHNRKLTSNMKTNSILSSSLCGGLVPISTDNICRGNELNKDDSMTTSAKIKSLTLKKIFKGMIDKELFCNGLFQTNILVSTLAVPGFALFTTYLPHHMKDIGFSGQTAAILLSITGGVDLLNKIVLAVISDRKFINRPILVGCALIVSGGVMFVTPSVTNFRTLVGVMVVYGLFYGTYVTMTAVLIIDAVGREKLSRGIGIFSLVHGLAVSAVNIACGESIYFHRTS